VGFFIFQLAAHVVEHVDAGDEAVELVGARDDRDVVAVEDRDDLIKRLVGGERLELARHVLAHDIAEVRGAGAHGGEHVVLVDDPDDLLAFQHR
jgi:hypothetical protein